MSFTVNVGQQVAITVPARRGIGGYHIGPNDVWIPAATTGLVVGPAPLEEPTGFGARVRATYAGQRVRAVRTDSNGSLVWLLRLIGGRAYWASWGELKDPELLDAGETE